MCRHKQAIAAGAIAALALSAIGADAQTIPSAPAQAAGAKGAAKGQPGAGEAAAKKDPAAALKLLEAGVKSYETGKLEPAAQSLTQALAGGLPSQQMARALYYRGLVYRKQAKPAQAISDLTSAIWLKGGLLEAERANAIESRAAAYREAGLGDPPPVGESSRAAATTAAPAAPAAASAPPAASTSPAASSGAWQTATRGPGQGPASQASGGNISGGSTASTPSSGLAVASDTAAAVTPPPASVTGSGSSFGNLFSGLFGGGSSSAAAKSASPPTTASTGPLGASGSATSSWSDATTVANRGSRTAAAVPTAAPPAASAPAKAAEPAAKPVPKGKFRLQVAAVRSRAEAETLAQKLKQAHGPAIGGREPAIEESVIGAMGTFYRVRLGPYADANEPRQLCSRIKPDGFDCLVVTQ